MKRYIWTDFFIDTVKNLYFGSPPELQARERENIKGILVPEHGERNIDEKVQRYFAFKPPDFVVMTEFHPMLQEVQSAYTSGYLYPALTGACCIGERILNLLMLKLRDYHKSSPLYKEVYRKQSFDDWSICIRTLREWNVLSDDIANTFDELRGIRNESIHFRSLPDLEKRAINALAAVLKVTDSLFGFRQDLFFVNGHLFVKKEKENDPLVREFYIPKCLYAGYRYRIEQRNGQATLVDDYQYENGEISDEEFIARMKQSQA